MDLRQLAERYGCDQLVAHSYVDAYEELLRNRDVRAMFIIGIGYADLMKPFSPTWVHGANLKMFRDYLPKATIYGCDIRQDVVFCDDRIETYLCDSTQQEIVALLHTLPPIDVVIDDGSHEPGDQIKTAQLIYPELPPGAVYVIEDVRDTQLVFFALLKMVRRLTTVRSDNPMTVHCFNKRPDDNLVVMYR